MYHFDHLGYNENFYNKDVTAITGAKRKQTLFSLSVEYILSVLNVLNFFNFKFSKFHELINL